MKFKYVLILSLLAAGTIAHAQNKDVQFFQLRSAVQKKTADTPVLHLILSETTAHSGLCDYYVKNFRYERTEKTLYIDVKREICFNDGYGKTKANVYWQIPPHLQKLNSKLCVVVNDQVIDAISYVDEDRHFSVDESGEGCAARRSAAK